MVISQADGAAPAVVVKVAQFGFFGTWDDSWNLLSLLERRGDVSFILDVWRSSPEIQVFSIVSHRFRGMLRDHPRLFVLPRIYLDAPGRATLQNSGEKSGQYFMRETGGPFLSLTLPACYEESDCICLNTGRLSYPVKYFDYCTDDGLPAPDALKLTYRDIVKSFKKALLKHKVNSTVWIGHHALKLLKEGRARIVALGV